jgi:hypothetical protein
VKRAISRLLAYVVTELPALCPILINFVFSIRTPPPISIRDAFSQTIFGNFYNSEYLNELNGGV